MSIETVPGSTPDQHEELLTQLRDLVPEAFRDGDLNADSLLKALGARDEDGSGFTFSWPGIAQARDDARAATTATLAPDMDASMAWDEAKDVLIEGDNLQVLKLLKNGYARAVKLIYIDPPYNTGNTFNYHDDFAVPERQYLEENGQVDDQDLFDHVDYDSHVDRTFAEQLENNRDQVRLFTKLPRRFRVRTSVGEYSPDWAIVYDENGTQRLYLVRETKDTRNLKDLDWDEAMRIEFANRHFDAAPLGPVDYNHTTDEAGLLVSETEGES